MLSIIISFPDRMKGTVNYEGPFTLTGGVKSGFTSASTTFEAIFSVLFSYAIEVAQEGSYYPDLSTSYVST